MLSQSRDSAGLTGSIEEASICQAAQRLSKEILGQHHVTEGKYGLDCHGADHNHQTYNVELVTHDVMLSVESEHGVAARQGCCSCFISKQSISRL